MSDRPFKMHTICHAALMLRPGFWLNSVDISSAFFHVKLSKKYIPLTQFCWNNRVFAFACCPQGLKIAPFVFNSIGKSLTSYLRLRLIDIFIYIDDTLLVASNYQKALRNTRFTVEFLQKCGLIVNMDKSQLIPAQRLEFLGFILDSIQFSISVSDTKRSQLHGLVMKILRQPARRITLRFLASIVGKMVSFFPASSEAPLHYRVLERFKVKCLIRNNKWNQKVIISPECVRELEWWSQHLLHPYKFMKSLHPIRVSLHMYSDSSGFAWGCAIPSLQRQAQGRFTQKQASHSINTKELLAIYFGVLSFREDLRGSNLQVHTDNCTALASISKKGSSNAIRDKITRHIFEHMSQLGTTLQAVFMEGRSNLEADGLSHRVRQNRFTDWSINDDTWKLICKHFRSKPNLDAFATAHNARLDCYCAWVRDLRSTYVDAFQLNWNQFKIYAFPPPSVIGRCLQKIQEDVALEVGMIVPLWPTSYWFTTMVNLLCAMPVLLPKVTVRKLRLPWDPSATHPLANNLRLLFVHLSAKSCEAMDVSLIRF